MTILDLRTVLTTSKNGTAVREENKPVIAEEKKGGLEVKREGELLIAEPKTQNKKPPFYKVLMLNDDFTPMEFVVYVLKTLFHKPEEDAIRIMLQIHTQGAGIAGIFTRDVAETKVDQVIACARMNDHPLQCKMERE